MPFDPYVLPLPPYPYWSVAAFNEWFAPLYAAATTFRLSYPAQHSPAYLQPYVAQYMANGTVLTPLPTGWETLEFTDYMAALNKQGLADYYEYIFSRTPPYLIPAVAKRINYGLNPQDQAPVTVSFLTDVMPVEAALTRPSIGWARNNAGVLTSYAINAPRFQHDSVTNAALGLLNEYASTNTVRNNSMAGVVAGTPGTAPTNWSLPSTTDGVTRTIIGTGTEDGIPYIDVQYAGTPVAGSGKIATFDSTTNPAAPAAAGQTWIASFYCRLMAGSLTGIGTTIVAAERNAAGGNSGGLTNPISITGAPLRQQRFSAVRTFTGATTAFAAVQFSIAVNAGVPCDFTLRIGAPSMVQNPSITSIVLTTGAAAVTRAADVLTVTEAALTPAFWDVVLTRLSGVTNFTAVDLTGGGPLPVAVPNDPSPVQSLKFTMSI